MTTAHAPRLSWPAAVTARQSALAVYLVPRNIVVALLLGYRAVISPLYGDVCRYYPSCSAYALGAVQQHGVVIGVLLAARRLARCHPWAAGGVDDVPEPHSHHFRVNRLGFVVADRALSGRGKG